jgi:glycosyltransferase involved in cell wall biosynthesis
MCVYGFKPLDLVSAFRIYQEVDADIYHSQEPSLGSYLAMKAKPERKHIVTFNDPRNFKDWITEFSLPSLNRLQVLANWFYEDSWLVHQAVRRMNGWISSAQFVAAKSQAKYHLRHLPETIPDPVIIPEKVQKSETPTVCFVARMDRRKRPELFFELAKSFPDVRFIAAGKSRDPRRDQLLRNKYGHLPNLEMLGFVDQFQGDQFTRLLGESWILVNTAAREGLPNVFLEAAAHRCAILSAVDPDGFSSRFGYKVEADDFAAGLKVLLANDLWRQRGMAGYEFVSQNFLVDKVIDQHLSLYKNLLV